MKRISVSILNHQHLDLHLHLRLHLHGQVYLKVYFHGRVLVVPERQSNQFYALHRRNCSSFMAFLIQPQPRREKTHSLACYVDPLMGCRPQTGSGNAACVGIPRATQQEEGERLPPLKAKPQMHSVIKPFKRREKMLSIQLRTAQRML